MPPVSQGYEWSYYRVKEERSGIKLSQKRSVQQVTDKNAELRKKEESPKKIAKFGRKRAKRKWRSEIVSWNNSLWGQCNGVGKLINWAANKMWICARRPCSVLFLLHGSVYIVQGMEELPVTPVKPDQTSQSFCLILRWSRVFLKAGHHPLLACGIREIRIVIFSTIILCSPPSIDLWKLPLRRLINTRHSRPIHLNPECLTPS